MSGIELPVSRSLLAATGTSASDKTRYVGPSLENHRFVGEHVSLIPRSSATRVSLSPEARAEASMSAVAFLETRTPLRLRALLSRCADFAVSVPLLPTLPSLPFVFCRVGIIPGILLTVAVGFLAATTLRPREDESLIDARTGDACKEELRLATASVSRISFSIFHFGMLVADQVLLRDVTASIVNLLDARNLLLAFIFLLSSPFWLRALRSTVAASITQHSESLRLALGTISIIFFCSILSLRALQRSQLPHAHQHVRWVAAEAPSQFCLNLLLAFLIVLICFTAALVPDSFPVRQEKVLPSLYWHIALFCFVGISGYVFAGRETLDDVWLNFTPNDGLARCGKVVYCGSLWLFIPHTCRQGMQSTITTSNIGARSTMTAEAFGRRQSYCSVDSVPEVGETINCEADGSLSQEVERNLTQLGSTQLPPVEPSATAFASFLLLFSSFTIAMFVRHIVGVWFLLGSIIGTLLCFLLPPCRSRLRVHEEYAQLGLVP